MRKRATKKVPAKGEAPASPVDQLMERLMRREWGLPEKDRNAIKTSLVGIITDADAKNGDRVNAVLGLVETMKLDSIAVDQLIRGGLVQVLARQLEKQPGLKLVSDEDLASGIMALLEDKSTGVA